MANTTKTTETKPAILTCGLVMPISAIEGRSAEHWLEVKSILTESIESLTEPRFTVRLVSDADDIGVIQKRIVQNIYSSDIVVCDVSAKNPNVMFELGMRLAFDKSVVIVKDDNTDYSFDTGIIEHLTYPRDLRFQRIVEFKKSLATKIANTQRIASTTPDHSPFLKNFGKFQVATLSEMPVSGEKLVISMLEDLQTQVAILRRRDTLNRRHTSDELYGSRSSAVPSELLAAIKDYMVAEHIADPASLLGNEEAYAVIERKIDGPRFFETRPEFINRLEYVLRALSIEGNASPVTSGYYG